MDRAKYRALFVAESRDLLRRGVEDLLAWERSPRDTDRVASLFRSVHTLKGMAAALAYAGLANLAHALEHVLAAARDEEVEGSPALIDAALRALDAIEAGVSQVEAGADPSIPVDDLIATLGQVARPATGTWPVPAGAARPPGPPGPEGPGRPAAVDRQVRVGLARLDRLMVVAGELAVARNRLLQRLPLAGDPALHQAAHRLGRLVSEVQDQALQARLAPLAEVFERFPRTVRDLARQLGKAARVETAGQDIELDRAVLDQLPELLLHLLRNAVDHGLEPPAERAARGKPAEGTIRLSAVREGGMVVVAVEDDGRGVDRAAVVARAQALGLSAGRAAGDDDLLEILARPGFTTAAAVTEVSGRGVGIDAVVHRVRALGGATELASRPGAGTTVRLRLPVSVALVPAVVAVVGETRLAVPSAFVEEVARLEPGEAGTMRLRERVLPRLDLGGSRADAPWRPGVVLAVGGHAGALVVDTLLGEEDIVVGPLDGPRGTPRWVGGAAILSDGLPALVVDPSVLVG